MAKYLDLTDFRANLDYVLPNLGCRLVQDKKVIDGSGRIEIADNGTFRFIRQEQIFEFTVDNAGQDKFLRNYFQRGFVNLAQVIPTQNNEPSIFRLYVIFFSTIINLGNLSIIVDDEVLNRLAAKKLIRTTADGIEEELEQMPDKFYLQDFFGSDKKLFACVQAGEHFSIVDEDDYSAKPALVAEPDVEEEMPESTSEGSVKISAQKFSVEIFKSPPKSGRYEIVKVNKDARTLILKPLGKTELVAPNGYLFYDDSDDQIQIFRRQNARERIENGTSANPHLGWIIGGGDDVSSQFGGFLTAKTSKKEVQALTENVKAKIFKKHSATPNQEAAIKIALNTPDIAIIQGPPGTGKTTVITAILERLNELADKKELQRGQVLITSLQHDAVENVRKRVSINSLPTVKFGTRRGDEKDLDETVENWCIDLAKKIREKNPKLHESAELIELEQTFNFYLVNPINDNAVTFLEKARSLVTDKNLLTEIEFQLEKFNPAPERQIKDDLVNLIRRLRTTKYSFADDGAEVADLLLYRLENKKILDTLKDAADCFDEEPTKDLLKALRTCKNILLKRCIPKPNYREQTLSPELLDLHVRVKNFLAKPSEGVDNILYNLLNELENNSEVVHNSLKDYAFVFAATAQQSERKEIKEYKGQKPEYDTVIVDEAARVNPGDLMIPLSQAKTRIIMVGDHRQLPHMYDEEIFEQLNEEGEEINPLNIKESMFGYLLRRAQSLKEKDNIDRFITLNAQYRMHPELGNFVSRNEKFLRTLRG